MPTPNYTLSLNGSLLKQYLHFHVSYYEWLETRCFIAIALQLRLEYAIERLHANQKGLKLRCTHRFLGYAVNVNIWGGSVHTTKKKTEAMTVTSKKDIGPEVNAEKTKYLVMSPAQHAGQNHNVNTGNKSSERVEEFK
jgi:hypothetical protein